MGPDSAPPVPHGWEWAAPFTCSKQLCREQGAAPKEGVSHLEPLGSCALCQRQWLPRARCHRATHLLEGLFSWQRHRGFVFKYLRV